LKGIKKVGNLGLEHKVLMGAENSLGDQYLLVYLTRKKEFATYFYNTEFDSVTMGHYLYSAADGLKDLLNRAEKREKEIEVKIYAVKENIHLLKTGEVKY
jgi:hypothetical protein